MGSAHQRIFCLVNLLLIGLIAAGALFLSEARGQKLDLGASKFQKFRVPPAFYPGSNQKRLLLTGEQARPQGTNQLWIKDLRIDTFNRSGTTNLIIQSPECLYHTVRQTVTSDGSLRVRSGDGRFTLEGQKGFIFYQTNHNLVVSNQVHVLVDKQQASLTHSNLTIQSQPPSQPGSSTNQTLSIDCAKGSEWDFNAGLAFFRGDVRVTDQAGFQLRCELLTIHFNPAGTTNTFTGLSTSSAGSSVTSTNDSGEANLRLQKITAEQNVAIQFDMGRGQMGEALCEQVVYTATNDLAVINQAKSINLPQGTITASTLSWDRGNNRWSCPPSTAFRFDAKSSLFLPGGTNQLSGQAMVIQCDQGTDWDFNAGSAVFKGHVSVTEEPGFKLQCELLNVSFHPSMPTLATAQGALASPAPPLASTGARDASAGLSMRLEKIVAEREVDIAFNLGGGQVGNALCGQAVYTATNDTVYLEQVKRVDLPQGTITASTLAWDRRDNRWTCPPSSPFQFVAKPALFATGSTNKSHSPLLSIQCNQGADWNSKGGLAVFNGQVRVTEDPGFKLLCERLTVAFHSGGLTNEGSGNQLSTSIATNKLANFSSTNLAANFRLDKIVAEQDVDIHFEMGKGQLGQALGGTLVYTATNDLFTLSQVKRITIPQGIITASTVYWDRRSNKFSYAGNYRFDASSSLSRLYNLSGTNRPAAARPAP